MYNMIKRILFAMLVVLLVAGIAGCSGSKEKDVKVEDSLTRVQNAGEISFAGSGGYPPFNFYNEKNELVGFDVDVAGEIAKRLGVEADYVTTAWDGIIEGLRVGHYDGILGSMAITEARLKVVNFTTPYYYSGAQLVVRKDADIDGPDDLQEAVIGVVTGTTFEEDANKIAGVKEVALYEDDNQTLRELLSNRLDGVITDRVVAVNGINALAQGNQLVLAGSILRSEDIGIAIRKEDETLLAEINKILSEMHSDGTLSELSQKWLQADITKQ